VTGVQTCALPISEITEATKENQQELSYDGQTEPPKLEEDE
jgi:hypothetical protein